MNRYVVETLTRVEAIRITNHGSRISNYKIFYYQKRLNRPRTLTTFSRMRVVTRLLVIVALCFAIGLHWCALQSIAWTTMVIEYSKDAPFAEALAKALDGQHPCSLCHAVNNGKNSEKKSDMQRSTPKIDMICAPSAIRLMPPFSRLEYLSSDFSLCEFRQSPAVPPPRSERA